MGISGFRLRIFSSALLERFQIRDLHHFDLEVFKRSRGATVLAQMFTLDTRASLLVACELHVRSAIWFEGRVGWGRLKHRDRCVQSQRSTRSAKRSTVTRAEKSRRSPA